MRQRLQIPLLDLLLKYPVKGSQQPRCVSSLESLTTIPAQLGRDSLGFSYPKFSRIPDVSFYTSGYPIARNIETQSLVYETRRGYSSDSGGDSELDVNKEVDKINLKFAEAREEIELAMESKETVYFNEEADCAREVVKEVLESFDELLKKLPESQKSALQRSMGLKMEQLKAELEQLND